MPDNLMRAALEDAGPRLLYPLPEARAILGGIGHSTLYELFKANELTKVSIGRRAFVTGESLVAYVDRLSGADVEQNTVRTDGPCEAGVEQSTLQCTDPSPPRATA